MAMPREQAFGVFEELLREGLRPCLTGFRSQDDRNQFWPKDTEGFFVSTRLTTHRQAPHTIDALTRMHEIAERHGLTAWFSGCESGPDEDDAPIYGVRVVFEAEKSGHGFPAET